MAVRWQPAYRPLTPAEATSVAATGGLLVVHFWAMWNGVDRKYNPVLEPVRDQFAGRAVFRSVDVDDAAFEPLTRSCGMVNVPTVAGLVGGTCVESLVGLRPAVELAARIGKWVRNARRVIDPRWRTADVLGVARGIAADEAVGRLPMLADALMDAGCADEGVLAACRHAGPDAVGWWVVDLLLGQP